MGGGGGGGHIIFGLLSTASETAHIVQNQMRGGLQMMNQLRHEKCNISVYAWRDTKTMKNRSWDSQPSGQESNLRSPEGDVLTTTPKQ
jgi:hypothetical protein